MTIVRREGCQEGPALPVAIRDVELARFGEALVLGVEDLFLEPSAGPFGVVELRAQRRELPAGRVDGDLEDVVGRLFELTERPAIGLAAVANPEGGERGERTTRSASRYCRLYENGFGALGVHGERLECRVEPHGSSPTAKCGVLLS